MLIRTKLYNHTYSPLMIQTTNARVLGKDKETESHEQAIKNSTFPFQAGVFVKPFQEAEQYQSFQELVDFYEGPIYFDETIYTDSTAFKTFGVITGIQAPIRPKKFVLYHSFPLIAAFSYESITPSNYNNILELTISLKNFDIIKMLQDYFKLLGLRYELKNIRLFLNGNIYNHKSYDIAEQGMHILHDREGEDELINVQVHECSRTGFHEVEISGPQFIQFLESRGDIYKLYYDINEDDQKIYVKIKYSTIKSLIQNIQGKWANKISNLINNINQYLNSDGFLETISSLPIQTIPIGFDVVYKLYGGGTEQTYNIKIFSGIILQGEIPNQIKGEAERLTGTIPEFKAYTFDKYLLFPVKYNQKFRKDDIYYIKFNILANVPLDSTQKARIRNISFNPQPPPGYGFIIKTRFGSDLTNTNMFFTNTKNSIANFYDFYLFIDNSTNPTPLDYTGDIIITIEDYTQPDNIRIYTLTANLNLTTELNEPGKLAIKFSNAHDMEHTHLSIGQSKYIYYDLQNYHRNGYVKIKDIKIAKYLVYYTDLGNPVYLPLDKFSSEYLQISTDVYKQFEKFKNLFNLSFSENYKDTVIGPNETKRLNTYITIPGLLSLVDEQNKYIMRNFPSNTKLNLDLIIYQEDSTGQEFITTPKNYTDLHLKFESLLKLPELELNFNPGGQITNIFNLPSYTSNTQATRQINDTILIFKDTITEIPVEITKLQNITILDADIRLKKKIDGNKTSFVFGQDYFINKSEYFPITFAPSEFSIIFDINEEGIWEFELVLKTDNIYLPEIKYNFRIISIDANITNYITQDRNNFFVENNQYHIALNKLIPKFVNFPIKNYSRVDLKLKKIKVQSSQDKYGNDDLDITLNIDYINQKIAEDGYYLFKSGEVLNIPAKIKAKDYGFSIAFIILEFEAFGEIWLPISGFCNNRIDKNVYIYKTSPNYIQVYSAVGQSSVFYVKYKNFGDDPAIVEQEILGAARRDYYTIPVGILYGKKETRYPVIFLPFAEGQRIAYLSSKILDQVISYRLFETDFTTTYKLQNLHIITKLLGYARPQEATPKFAREIINSGYISEDEINRSLKSYLRIIATPLENAGLNDMQVLKFESFYDDFCNIINQDQDKGQYIPSLGVYNILLGIDKSKLQKYLRENRRALIQKFKFYIQDIKLRKIKTVDLLINLYIAKSDEIFLDFNLDKIDFGLKEINVITSESLTISNFSTVPIEIKVDLTAQENNIFSTFNNLRLNLQPNQIFTIPVSFIPKALTSYSATLTISIYRNNTLLKTYEIPISGSGTHLKTPDFKFYNQISQSLKPLLKELQKEFNKANFEIPI